jgi:hypothetical protein
VRVECATAAVVGLQWDAPPSAGVRGYVVFRNGEKLDDTPQTFFADITVSASSEYLYSVSTVDRWGNTSVPAPLQVTTSSAASSASAPYCGSSVISSATFDWSLGYTEPNGSDLWSVTWGADGNVYAFFGDGGGIGGDNDRGRASFGMAAFTGPPPPTAPAAHNVYGGFQTSHPATLYGKASSIIAVGKDFYAVGGIYNAAEIAAHPKHLSAAPNHVQLVYSHGNAYSWKTVPWNFCWANEAATELSGHFCPLGFVNFGRGNADAPDHYIYLVGVENDRGFWLDDTPGAVPMRTYLARARKSRLRAASAYQYFVGLDSRGHSIWSADWERKRPVFSDRNGTQPGCGGVCGMNSVLGDIVYDAGLKRFLGVAQGPFIGQTSFYEALEPWGPWKVIQYNNINPQDARGGWANLGKAGGNSIGVHVVNAWTSPDGLDLWLTYSSDGKAPSGALFPPAGTSMDSLNVVRAHLISK